jgi:hypothetical protein
VPTAQPVVAAAEGLTGSVGWRSSVATPRLRRGSSRPVVRSIVLFEAAFAAERQGRWAAAMKREGFAEIAVRLAEGVAISFSDALEVSLDCESCRRRCRTVVFARPGVAGRCTPTGHEFNGRLLRVLPSASKVRYEFEYRYSPFIDAKYPDEQRYGGIERGAPTWVRASFEVVCAACGRSAKGSTQTNIVRPWACLCACTKLLYEDVSPPSIGWSQAAP